MSDPYEPIEASAVEGPRPRKVRPWAGRGSDPEVNETAADADDEGTEADDVAADEVIEATVVEDVEPAEPEADEDGEDPVESVDEVEPADSAPPLFDQAAYDEVPDDDAPVDLDGLEEPEAEPPVPSGLPLFDQDLADGPALVHEPPGTLGPAALQVLVSRLTGIAEEMGAVLRRAAFSPNIKERADCSAALFDADGELLVQAEHIPVHLGSMPAAVAAGIDAFGDEIEPGEQIVLNDPFAGGTHLNDITVVAPCFVDDELVGWVANRAHHADLGGATPGSIPPEAVEIQQEGLRLPPVRLTSDVREVIVASSRTPDERRGDLDAQWGANVVGLERLAAEAGQPLQEVAAYGERRMRAALAALPDGAWDFTDVLDSTGPRPDQQAAARIYVCVRIEGDEITFDFTGTDDQRPGNVNAVEAVTLSAVAFALRSAVVPDLEGVGGSMRPVTVVAPAGTLVAAQPPVAVGAGNVEVSQRIADVCLGALAQIVPDRVPAASQGTMNNVLIGGDGWVYYETVAGGQGARPDRPGMNGVHTGMTNTRNTPVEALERAFPLRVRRLRLREGSGGDGRQRGGEGIERDLEVLEPVTVSLITERRVFPPWGLDGGGPGALGENWLLPDGDETRAERVGDKVSFELRAGDVLRLRTPGGGGHGPADGG